MNDRKINGVRAIVTAMTVVATTLTASVVHADDSAGTMTAPAATTAAATNGDGSESTDAPKPHHHHHHEETKASSDAPKAEAAPTAETKPAPTPEAPKPIAAPEASAPTATPLQLRETHETHPITLAPEPPAYAGLKLAGILALLGAGAWALKRRQDQRKPAETVRSLQVLKKLTIGVRSELLVVDVDGQRLLLGVTPNSIQTLASLPDLDAAAEEEAVDHSRTATTFRPERPLGEKSHALGERLAALVERSRSAESDASLADPRNDRSSPDLRTTARPARSLAKRPTSTTESLEGQARGLSKIGRIG